jgi:hypothetical protein
MSVNQEYGWIDGTLVMKGKIVAGCQGIMYKTSQNSALIHGRGAEPIAFGKGKKEYNGSITLLMSEVIALDDAAGTDKDITSIPPFIVTWTLAKADGSGVDTWEMPVLHIQEVNIDWNTESMSLSVTLPLLVGRVRRVK